MFIYIIVRLYITCALVDCTMYFLEFIFDLDEDIQIQTIVTSVGDHSNANVFLAFWIIFVTYDFMIELLIKLKFIDLSFFDHAPPTLYPTVYNYIKKIPQNLRKRPIKIITIAYPINKGEKPETMHQENILSASPKAVQDNVSKVSQIGERQL